MGLFEIWCEIKGKKDKEKGILSLIRLDKFGMLFLH